MRETREDIEQVDVLPLGRRSPRGKLRWYLVACPVGEEDSTCAEVRKIVPQPTLQDAFVPRAERVRKFHGQWKTYTVQLFSGYFVAATSDAPALQRALAKLSFPVQLAGSVGRGYAPIDEDAQQFLSQCMDQSHTIRKSEGEIVADQLHVLWGPLKGQESRVSKYVRSKCLARVRMGKDSGSPFTLSMPLAIPERR